MQFLLSLFAACTLAAAPVERELEIAGRIEFDAIDESSALVASPQFKDVFWTLNDSGDKARIFAIDSSGALIKPDWVKKYKGLIVEAASNIDWEDISTDNAGNLIIAACGNNGNARKDLAVYVLPEPNPRAVNKSRALKRIDFHYPDQVDFPPQMRNFDCEAVCFTGGALHFLSKHRSDDRTKLYRLDPIKARPGLPWYSAFEEGLSYELNLLGNQQVQGLYPGVPAMVTAADADEKRMVLLSQHSLYLYKLGKSVLEEGNLLLGERFWLPISAKQCEAVALRGDWIWITNEQRSIFRVHVSELLPSPVE